MNSLIHKITLLGGKVVSVKETPSSTLCLCVFTLVRLANKAYNSTWLTITAFPSFLEMCELKFVVVKCL